MQRVTFSRNYTLSLSRTCQCYCKYCAFATRQAHIHEPAEVERMLDEAVRRSSKELLVLTRPRSTLVAAARAVGPRRPPPTSRDCERPLDRGCCRTNLGVLSRKTWLGCAR
jgi:FO synthase